MDKIFVDFFKKEKTSFHHKWNGTRFIITRKWMYELPHELPNDVRRKDPIKLRDFKKITWYSWNRRGMPSGTPLSIPWQLSFSHITKKWPAKHSIEKQNFNFTKWSNTFKQFVGNLPTNCLSVFADFVGLALKGLGLLVIHYNWVLPRKSNFHYLVKISVSDFCGASRFLGKGSSSS